MGDQKEKRKRMSCALEIPNPACLMSVLHFACGDGYHFIVTNMAHPHFSKDLMREDSSKIIGRTDRVLSSFDWNKLVVTRLSKVFEVDSEIEYIREGDKKLLKQELGFANHLALPALMVDLTRGDKRNFGQILYNKLQGGTSYQIWMCVPMVDPVKYSKLKSGESGEDTWEWWNDLRRYTHYHKKLGVVLELPPVDCVLSDHEMERWIGEPIKVVVIPTKAFISNHHNQPVLLKAHQEIIRKFMALDVQYIIKGPNYKFTYAQYCSYMNYLGKKLYDGSLISEFSFGCEDFLQNPLQPLSEHLEAPIYEIFEKDSVKYTKYQEAIQAALENFPKTDKPIIIMVVGAGRGPLVQACLNASYLTQRIIKVYAVEKNPYAVNTLLERIENEWNNVVTLIHQDMRFCKPPEEADILVSELLGSFGDNELSPECLDGAQRFLKRTGISIPQSYTSFLAPLQSTKLFNEISANKPFDKTLQSLHETPYIVHLVNVYQIAESQPLFTFEHPNWKTRIINERVTTLKFTAKQNCLLTGFAGFFETVLFGDVMLSTNPKTHSENMVSWFPILFSLQEPVQVLANCTIEVTFWRVENEEKVWYEWCLNSPVRGSISNVNGRSYFIKKF